MQFVCLKGNKKIWIFNFKAFFDGARDSFWHCQHSLMTDGLFMELLGLLKLNYGKNK